MNPVKKTEGEKEGGTAKIEEEEADEDEIRSFRLHLCDQSEGVKLGPKKFIVIDILPSNAEE